jgi:hypothetical protein
MIQVQLRKAARQIPGSKQRSICRYQIEHEIEQSTCRATLLRRVVSAPPCRHRFDCRRARPVDEELRFYCLLRRVLIYREAAPVACGGSRGRTQTCFDIVAAAGSAGRTDQMRDRRSNRLPSTEATESVRVVDINLGNSTEKRFVTRAQSAPLPSCAPSQSPPYPPTPPQPRETARSRRTALATPNKSIAYTTIR